MTAGVGSFSSKRGPWSRSHAKKGRHRPCFLCLPGGDSAARAGAVDTLCRRKGKALPASAAGQSPARAWQPDCLMNKEEVLTSSLQKVAWS